MVKEGEEVKIEKIKNKKEGDEVIFDKVLLTEIKDKTNIGKPFLKGAKVKGEISEKGRRKKITVLKFKNKTRQMTKKGHKQPYMKVKIKSIS